ncbi:MAG: glycosyltransferase family 39 protein [Halioglobus sp.]|nr:glycosyltransferase family 39 protein [Halioglobus sp.]
MSTQANSDAFFCDRKVLLLIFLAALLIRVVFVFTLKDGFYFSDEFNYTVIASHVVEHGTLPESFDRSPLFPIFVAGLFKLGGESLLYIRVVQAIIGAIVAVQIALIGRRIGGSFVGIIAGTLWTIYPMGVFMSGILYPAIILACLMTSAVLCLLEKPDGPAYVAWVALAGLLLGASTLAKPMAFASIIFVAFWLLMQKTPGRLLLTSVFLSTALMSLLPWTLHNAVKHGKFIPVESRALEKLVPWAKQPKAPVTADKRKQRQLRQATGDSAPVTRPKVEETSDKPEHKPLGQAKHNNNPVTQGTTNNELLAMFTQMAKRYPGEFLSFFEVYPTRVGFLNQAHREKARRKKTERFVRYIPFGSDLVMSVSMLSVGSLYFFAVVGIGSMWREREKRRELSLFILLVLSFALSYALSWGKIRYRVPVDPYIILLSAWGIVACWNKVFNKEPTTPPPQDAT